MNHGLETNDINATEADLNEIKSIPTIILTTEANRQLGLMLKNDFTLSGKYLRIVISGKGCDGFTYAVGFTDLEDEDVQIPTKDGNLVVIMDPFASFYLQNATIDYQIDTTANQEGFIVVNHGQNKFKGKFWKGNSSKVLNI